MLRRFLACGALIGAFLGGIPAQERPLHVTRGAQVDWPLVGNTADQQRFSQLTAINRQTVSRLSVAWTLSEGQAATAWEDDPVVVDGVMYVTTSTGQVIALRADSGRRLWTYTPAVDFLRIFARAGIVAPVNRGVTVVGNALYLLTFDDRLIKLSTASGRRIWQTTVADAATYYEQSPPAYWQGLLLLGEASAGPGTRGFVAAFDAATGRLRWRFYTVPARGTGWASGTSPAGGGDVWMPVTVDPASGIAYVATGNPTPALNNRYRPGCDQWTDATLALDARSGRLLWGRSQVCSDVWDYDSAQSPLLLTVRYKGRRLRAIGQGNKSGRYWLFDAHTGATLALSPALGIQTTPRPIPSPRGVRVCPGIYGSLEYSPPAYSPLTGLIYLPGLNLCTIDRTLPSSGGAPQSPAVMAFGGTAKAAPGPRSGFLAALDPTRGRLRWQVHLPRPLIGGALATAGGLVFSGCDDGYLYAVDAERGTIRWRLALGLGVGAAPITYMVHGTQYLALATGGSSESPETGGQPGGLLVVWRLAGASPPR